MKVAKLYSNNTSGFRGVNWNEEKQKWHAKISLKKKRLHLGYFSSAEKAALAYEKAKRKALV